MMHVDLFNFLMAAIILNLTPGADTLLVLSTSMNSGWKAGIKAALGISLGSLTHAMIAGFGLAAFLKTSEHALFLVKVGGSIYLLYLAISELIAFRKRSGFSKLNDLPSEDKSFQRGFITNILNPKASLFFLALMPQFIHGKDAQGDPFVFFVLGIIFCTTSTLWLGTISFFSGFFFKKLKEPATNSASKLISALVFSILAAAVWV